MLLIPTLPALTPVAGIVTNSSDPLSILKNSVTVRMPTWRLSSSGNIASVNVAIPVEKRFLKVKSCKSKLLVITTSWTV